MVPSKAGTSKPNIFLILILGPLKQETLAMQTTRSFGVELGGGMGKRGLFDSKDTGDPLRPYVRVQH